MRRIACQHLVEHAADGVDVGARGDLLLGGRLLGAHVVRRAEAEAGLGHAAAGRCAHGERDAEVGDHRAAVVEQDVLGLDVAVDDAVAVRVVQGVGDIAGDADGLVHTELRLAVELVADRLALDVRHYIVEEAVGGARVEEGEDVRVLKACRGLDLLDKALGAEDGGELGLQELEGDLAVVLEVVGEEDGGHAALAEVAVNAVAAGEGGVETFGLRGHGPKMRVAVGYGEAAEPIVGRQVT